MVRRPCDRWRRHCQQKSRFSCHGYALGRAAPMRHALQMSICEIEIQPLPRSLKRRCGLQRLNVRVHATLPARAFGYTSHLGRTQVSDGLAFSRA